MKNPKIDNEQLLIDIIVERLNIFMKNGMSQYQLAKLSNLPLSTIKNIFQKRAKSVNLKTIILICHGLNITLSEFFDDDKFLAENLNLD